MRSRGALPPPPEPPGADILWSAASRARLTLSLDRARLAAAAVSRWAPYRRPISTSSRRSISSSSSFDCTFRPLFLDPLFQPLQLLLHPGLPTRKQQFHLVQDDLHVRDLFRHILHEKPLAWLTELLRPPQLQQCFGKLRHLFQYHVHLGAFSVVFQRIQQDLAGVRSPRRSLHGPADLILKYPGKRPENVLDCRISLFITLLRLPLDLPVCQQQGLHRVLLPNQVFHVPPSSFEIAGTPCGTGKV